MKKKIIMLIVLSFLCFNMTISSASEEQEKWPTLDQEYPELVQIGLEGYEKSSRNYQKYLADYSMTGDYLNWGLYVNHRNVEGTVLLDAQGIPQVNYNGSWYYNPVTVAQYALSQYGKYVLGKQTNEKFLQAADKLLTLGDEDGAYRYTTRYRYSVTGAYFEPGWVSGMSQGHALSVYARAYVLTNDSKYLEAGNKALEFMSTPVEQGGTMDTLKDLDPSLSEYIIFEEYPTTPATYTLNGFIFSILGVYDWWQVDSINHLHEKELFNKSIKTLENILPYYDLGGFTSYDLSHFNYDEEPTVNNHYHEVHIYQLNALFSVTNSYKLKYFQRVWAGYVNKDVEQELPLKFIGVTTSLKSPQQKQIQIDIKANTNGGVDVQYEFLIKEDGVWRLVQPYSTNDTFHWTPTDAKIYYFQVQIKEKNSTNKYDYVKTLRFDITN